MPLWNQYGHGSRRHPEFVERAPDQLRTDALYNDPVHLVIAYKVHLDAFSRELLCDLRRRGARITTLDVGDAPLDHFKDRCVASLLTAPSDRRTLPLLTALVLATV